MQQFLPPQHRQKISSSSRLLHVDALQHPQQKYLPLLCPAPISYLFHVALEPKKKKGNVAKVAAGQQLASLCPFVGESSKGPAFISPIGSCVYNSALLFCASPLARLAWIAVHWLR